MRYQEKKCTQLTNYKQHLFNVTENYSKTKKGLAIKCLNHTVTDHTKSIINLKNYKIVQIS